MLRKVLVVDDSVTNRMILARILQDDYTVLQAEDGARALELLSSTDVSAVLLDIFMPVLDGFGVLSAMKNDDRLSAVPVIITTGSSESDVEIKALSMGANDYIIKPYNPTIIKHRLANTISLRETSAIINSVQKDALTGLYNKEFFYKEAENTIVSNPGVRYDIICGDIERFKMINELFGQATGDKLLRYIADLLKATVGDGGICGRIGADKFAALINHSDSRIYDFDNATERVNSFPVSISIKVSYGIYSVDDTTLPVSTMCDRALTACNSIKGKYGHYYAFYDDSLRKKMLAEQFILDSMTSGITQRQFKVYYQPKNTLATGEVVGAEALVRWIHPERGFMSPGEFIPLFEKNGFITDLDIYVWETVCSDLHRWILQGAAPIPVSVNVSRADIYNPNLLDILLSLIEKYSLSPEYLHLEITESAYMEDSRQLISTVSSLKEHGFIIEMDDFGTGYSSLNMLSDLPINIVKLDMSFIREIDDMRKRSVLKTVIYLAGQLGLPVVAEGVETSEQASILQNIGCQYAQGYYYARPLCCADFERHIGVPQV